MFRENARAFCASNPRSQRIRVTIGSRPGEFDQDNFAGAQSVFEYRARWSIVANFLGDLRADQVAYTCCLANRPVRTWR